MNLNGSEYYYIYNAQSDVIALFGGQENAVVVEYTYDAWGKPLGVTGLLSASVGVKNPYRYRGYRYDEETGLYYLQSRYYNPRVGRFINADGLVLDGSTLLEMNLFAYCVGNPVLYYDPTGKMHAAPDEGCGGMGKGAPASTRISAEKVGDVSNCYTFALLLPNELMNPGGYSDNKYSDVSDVRQVAASVVSDVQTLGGTIRLLRGPNDPISDGEHRLALRVGKDDYHFMLQLHDGDQWMERRGVEGDVIIWDEGYTPGMLAWMMDDVIRGEKVGVEYYNSERVYFGFTSPYAK